MSNKLLTLIVALLSLVGIGLFLMVVYTGVEDKVALSEAVSPLVTYSLVLLGLTVVVAIVASLFGLFKNPAALKKSLLGIVGVAVILLIAYLIADSSEVINAKQEVLAKEGGLISKLTSTGIWGSIVLILIAGAFFVFDLIKSLVK